jgi:hypothetical protein
MFQATESTNEDSKNAVSHIKKTGAHYRARKNLMEKETEQMVLQFGNGDF